MASLGAIDLCAYLSRASLAAPVYPLALCFRLFRIGYHLWMLRFIVFWEGISILAVHFRRQCLRHWNLSF